VERLVIHLVQTYGRVYKRKKSENRLRSYRHEFGVFLFCGHSVVAVVCKLISNLGTSHSARHSLGDRAFPFAAARAWNSLPSFVRDQQSLAAFRQQLKTVLFRTSFGEDANT